MASAVRPSDNTAVTLYVPDAELWSMDTPNLYTVTARLQRNNETYDEVSAEVGVRSFSVTRTAASSSTAWLPRCAVSPAIRTDV